MKGDHSVLDLRALRYFVRVAEMKSISRAATSLYVAQPAISRQIKKLEEHIGVPLLVRSGRGVDLTDAGVLLETRARAVLAHLAEIQDEVSDCVDEPRGVVSLAVTPAAGRILVPPLMLQMRTRFPRVSLKIIESFTSVIHEALRAKRYHIGVLHDPDDAQHLTTEALLYERLFVVGPASEETELPNSYSAQLLEELPLILPMAPNQLRILADSIAAAYQLKLNIVAEVDSIPIMKSLVENGYGKTLLSFGSVHDEVTRGVLTATPIHQPEIQRKLVIAWNVDQRLSNAARETIRLLHQSTASLISRGQWRGGSLRLGDGSLALPQTNNHTP